MLSGQSDFDTRAKSKAPYVTEDICQSSLDFKPNSDKILTQTDRK
ncbi:conserved hypothetical protein [Leuconostoc gasicomitatum]|nr:conserved hypothetical protein [Leuconostoc gasicomitatum]